METRTSLKGARFAAALWTTRGASIALKHVPEATATSATGMANASMRQQNACVTRDGSGVRARSALQRARESTASSAPGTGHARPQDSAKQTASATRATSGRRASASARAARPIRARDTANVGLTGPALHLPRQPPPRLMRRGAGAQVVRLRRVVAHWRLLRGVSRAPGLQGPHRVQLARNLHRRGCVSTAAGPPQRRPRLLPPGRASRGRPRLPCAAGQVVSGGPRVTPAPG
jgi:hypothetical protein